MEAKAPQQVRSRKTLEALLQATVRTLEAHGLEACTLPRVAEAAKVAPATVCRRFADEDVLMRAALLHVLEGGVTDKAVEAKALGRETLAETAERVVVEMLRRCRERPRLLQATSLFLAAHAGTEFAHTAAFPAGPDWYRETLLGLREMWRSQCALIPQLNDRAFAAEALKGALHEGDLLSFEQ